MDDPRHGPLKFVLSEYQGLIVLKCLKWIIGIHLKGGIIQEAKSLVKPTRDMVLKVRWRQESIREKYIDKSIAHYKSVRGQGTKYHIQTLKFNQMSIDSIKRQIEGIKRDIERWEESKNCGLPRRYFKSSGSKKS